MGEALGLDPLLDSTHRQAVDGRSNHGASEGASVSDERGDMVAEGQQDSSVANSSGSDDAQEIERLRDRLNYYESFDRLIQENIARSGELMREALDLRERTQAELGRSRAELKQEREDATRRLETERQSQRAIFSALMDELSTVRQSAERLSARVSEAVENIGNDIPSLAASTQPSQSSTTDRETSGLSAIDPFRSYQKDQPVLATQDESVVSDPTALTSAGEQDTEDESVIALPAAEAVAPGWEEVAPFSGDDGDAAADDLGQGVTPFEWSDQSIASDSPTEGQEREEGTSLEEVLARFASEASDTGAENVGLEEQGEPSRQFDAVLEELSSWGGDAEQGAANVEATSPTSDAGGFEHVEEPARDGGEDQGGSSESRAVTVLVHGVPRAATALSLQRHLAALDHISGVEAREYAEGVLRLQVTSTRPLEFSDLESWEDGQGIEPVHLHADVIEVRLPGADF